MIHTPLVVWIANYPEQLLIACTASKHSPISLTIAAQFGDPLPYPPQTHSETLNAIERVCALSDPCDIASFYKMCQNLHLNGVVEPFWKDWGNACPSLFLTPDSLHQWHKFYFDHPINCISMLKQLTGLACVLCALTEFIFQAQNLFLYDETLHSLSEALREFYHYKHFILTAGGRHGKNGPLNHFQIPKLELMQHVVQSTRAMGAPYQWSSNITECCHITHVKQPYCLSNRKDFHGQCCCFLDRQEKLHFFQLYMVLKSFPMFPHSRSLSSTGQSDLW
ncbi:hypothetical protein BDR06DRAFT_980194 [Suillus hirtellus]|nr:hypothetical protein BDR06DRAFT_980194 [Suillus hirtellus]